MSLRLPYISMRQQKLVEEQFDAIVAKTCPAKIVCYGMRTETRYSWSSFPTGSSETSMTSLDLLVISIEKDKRSRENVSNAIESLSSDEVRFITVVHSLEAVTSGLREGNPFFITLFQKGILLYENNSNPLENPANISHEKLFSSKRLALAQSFYQASCDCSSDENFETAMFLLHQSVELSCNELLKCRLGYRSTTHSLRKLFALAENVSPAITEIFPESTEEEFDLFELLQRAYVDVRYKQDYHVSPDDVFTLINRVSELLRQIEELCNEQVIDSFVSSSEKQQLIRLPDFESVEIATVADIILHKGDRSEIMIETTEGSEHIFQHFVSEKKLRLSVSSDMDRVIPYAIIHITYKMLTGIVVDASGTINCAEPIESDFLGIIQNGKGIIDLKVNVSSLDATVTKSGTLKLSGAADRAKVLNTGVGDFDGSDLEVSDAQVTIKDSGNISISVEDELVANLFGIGVLNLKGEPRLKTLSMNK